MAKTGRNEPCPCGSGKKYKQCCLANDEAAERAATKEPRRIGPLGFFEAIDDDYDGLDEASNAVVHLVRAGKLYEAERAAHALLKRFPHAHDGYDRLGMVYEARGDNRKAAECYRKVIACAREHPEGYEPEFYDHFQQLIEKLDPPDVEAAPQ